MTWTPTTERPEVDKETFKSGELLIRRKNGTHTVGTYDWRTDEYRTVGFEFLVEAECWMVIPE